MMRFMFALCCVVLSYHSVSGVLASAPPLPLEKKEDPKKDDVKKEGFFDKIKSFFSSLVGGKKDGVGSAGEKKDSPKGLPPLKETTGSVAEGGQAGAGVPQGLPPLQSSAEKKDSGTDVQKTETKDKEEKKN